MAGLALFWRSAGEPGRSVSELVRLTLETFYEAMVIQGKARHIEGSEEALHLLNEMAFNIPERGRSLVAKALAKESLKLEGFDPELIVKTPKGRVTGDHPLAQQVADKMRADQAAAAIESIDLPEEVETAEEANERRKREAEDEKRKMEELLKGEEDA